MKRRDEDVRAAPGSHPVLGGVILLYFVIALEVLIMISPFAAFFYAVFNPVLLFLAKWPASRWLAAFFLPHMVLPPGLFLKTIRVAGSVLFVAGSIVFLVCAGQVYSHKLFRRGPASGGLYLWIRHPQYLALGIAGLGLAILWPRFLTIVLWTAMVGLYTLLARDEERRMANQFGDQYREYMVRTGMFLPRGLEALGRRPLPRSPVLGPTLGFVILVFVAVGGAFALRAYTVNRLPLWSGGRVTALAILTGDGAMLERRMDDMLELPEVKARLARAPGPILVYVVPRQYVMQGMIADTGPEWWLYEHHQTLAMISDWIFHPFRHLQGGHAMHGSGGTPVPGPASGGVVRRLIFLSVATPREDATPASLFAINTARTPRFLADVDVHGLVLLEIKDLGPEPAGATFRRLCSSVRQARRRAGARSRGRARRGKRPRGARRSRGARARSPGRSRGTRRRARGSRCGSRGRRGSSGPRKGTTSSARTRCPAGEGRRRRPTVDCRAPERRERRGARSRRRDFRAAPRGPRDPGREPRTPRREPRAPEARVDVHVRDPARRADLHGARPARGRSLPRDRPALLLEIPLEIDRLLERHHPVVAEDEERVASR